MKISKIAQHYGRIGCLVSLAMLTPNAFSSEQYLTYTLLSDSKEILVRQSFGIEPSLKPVRLKKIQHLGRFRDGTELEFDPNTGEIMFVEYTYKDIEGYSCNDLDKLKVCIGGTQIVEKAYFPLTLDDEYSYPLAISGNTVSFKLVQN